MKKMLTAAVSLAVSATVMPALAYDQGDFILRAGLTTVAPNSDSEDINLPTGLVAEADVDDDTQLGLIPVYMVHQNWGIELLAATPFEHDIEAQGKGAIDGTNVDAGSTKHLPPTLSLQWYPRGGQEGWQPYLGLGVNWTVFFDEDVDSDLIALLGDLTGGAVDDAKLSLDQSFGLAAQAGVDIPVGENLSVNLGVQYIDIETEAKLKAQADGATAATVEFDVDIDPWVYTVGIAWRF
ncbi:MAG: OmpW family outer membrane protein [Halioglobus sp.]|nr:OmpW family outer membrane protein [Halioglobus sp.]